MKPMPTILIHGGCGRYESTTIANEEYDVYLRRIVKQAFTILTEQGAREATVQVLMMLENEKIFNAGTGSKLQQDGKVRMSAAYMDGSEQRY